MYSYFLATQSSCNGVGQCAVYHVARSHMLGNNADNATYDSNIETIKPNIVVGFMSLSLRRHDE